MAEQYPDTIKKAIKHLKKDFLPGADIFPEDERAIKLLIGWVKDAFVRTADNLLRSIDEQAVALGADPRIPGEFEVRIHPDDFGILARGQHERPPLSCGSLSHAALVVDHAVQPGCPVVRRVDV